MTTKFGFEIGEKVAVKCVGTDVWSTGTVTGFTAKRIKVYNDVRDLEGCYVPKNVKKDSDFDTREL